MHEKQVTWTTIDRPPVLRQWEMLSDTFEVEPIDAGLDDSPPHKKEMRRDGGECLSTNGRTEKHPPI